MTAYLFDTNAVLLLGFQASAVLGRSRSAVAAGQRYISQVCAIEIAVKHSIGKLPLPAPFETNFAHGFAELVRELSSEVLQIKLEHIDILSRLPLHHRDPFDRLIIAQAIAEDLTVVTNDRAFSAYPGLNTLDI